SRLAERAVDGFPARHHHSRHRARDGRYSRGGGAYRGDSRRTWFERDDQPMTAPRLTRTYLAAPSHRARMVQNAAASAADAVFLDLEDAVPPAEKAAALDAAVIALTSHDWGTKHVTVRLNSIETPSIRREIERLACITRLDAFLIPKAEAVSEIITIGRWITGPAESAKRPSRWNC